MSTTPPSTPRFATQVRVRYAETDADGVVYHSNYLIYFEVARVDLLRALGHPVTEVARRGYQLPVVEARVKYLRPAHLDDLLNVSLGLDSVGPASFTFDYEVTREDGLLLATGLTRLAVCECETGRAVATPPWLRDLPQAMAALAAERS